MNVLMTLAAVGAVGIGAYAEGAWVLVLFAVGTTLETYALDRSRRSVERADGARARRRRGSSPTDGAERLDAGRGGRPSARGSSSVRASASPSTARSSRAPRASTRRRSPASRSRSTRPRRRGLRRHAQRPAARSPSRVARGRRRLDARAGRRARRAGAGQPRAVRALRRPLRARLHAAGVRGRAAGGRRAARCSAATLDTWVYRGAGAADRRLPVLAGHLDPGRGRLRGRRARRAAACWSRAARRWRTSRACGPSRSTRPAR